MFNNENNFSLFSDLSVTNEMQKWMVMRRKWKNEFFFWIKVIWWNMIADERRKRNEKKWKKKRFHSSWWWLRSENIEINEENCAKLEKTFNNWNQ